MKEQDIEIERPSVDQVYMDMTIKLSTRSTDAKHKVASLIVGSNNRGIMCDGINGTASGEPNERTNFDHGDSGFIHSEMNAIMKLNPLDTQDKTLYVNLEPCPICAGLIRQNRTIKTVVWKRRKVNVEAFDDSGLEILSRAGIRLIEIK